MRGKATYPLIPEHGDFSFSKQCSTDAGERPLIQRWEGAFRVRAWGLRTDQAIRKGARHD